MLKMQRYLVAIMVLLLVLGLAGCTKTNTKTKNPAPQKAETINLTVSAAASLKDAIDEIKNNYVKEKPNVKVTLNYGASGALEQQIEQGAEVDLFISAATKQMDQLKPKGLIQEDTVKNLLGNQLVLIVPGDSKTDIKDFKEVTKVSINKLALGEPKSVPAGQYAEEVFNKLNILDSVKSKAVYAKDVKEVLTWVETGNTDAGVVYATDAKTTDKVKVIATAPEDTHSPIVYPAAVIKASKNQAAAKDLLAYLSSDKAKGVFEKYGFTFITK